MKNNHLSRRNFLKLSGKTGVTTAALLGSAQLGAMASASAQTNNDYKALVCVLLAGGADSFNLLVPKDNVAYQEYKNTRADLALPQEALLSLNNAENNGRTLGLHPRLTGMQSLYNQGQVAFLSNVGTLVEPTSTQALHNGTAKLPLGLFSHSDQISQWQTALPDIRANSGWGGRIADRLSTHNSNKRISMSISTSGSNEFQAGQTTDSFSILTGEKATPSLVTSEFEELNQALTTIYSNDSYVSPFRRSYRKVFNEAISANGEFEAAILGGQKLNTTFAADEFSAQMHMVAKTIAANQLLGMKRQTFFVTFGGWDHHDETIANMDRMVKPLNDGLSAFQAAMQELDLAQNVTTFTTSDFARTLSSNGRGSDHGWGGNAMIMGGAVKGGQVYGEYPSLALNNPLDTGRGVLMPTTSLDQYFAELALWFGVSPSELNDILPNASRFYDSASGTAPLGFLV